MKLLSIAGSLSGPAIILNCCILYFSCYGTLRGISANEKDIHLKELALVAIAGSLVVLYVPLVIRALFDCFNKYYAISTIIILELICSVVLYKVADAFNVNNQNG